MHTSFKMIQRVVVLCLFFSIAMFVTGWLNFKNSIPLNNDEVVWVNDAEVYEWRANANWDQFRWSDTLSDGWGSHDFRLFDQPHAAKYIFGFMLSHAEVKPWGGVFKAKNYAFFVDQNNSREFALNDSSTKEMLGTKTVNAIILCRKVSQVFALGFFLILFLFIAIQFSFIRAAIFLFFLTTNSIFNYNLRLATADSIALFFVSCSLISFYLAYKEKKNSKLYFLLLFFSSITTALASSTKINGWFLIVVFLIQATVSLVEMKKPHFKKYFFSLAFWLFCFFSFYIWLQPELWNNPVQGLIKFFRQRYFQQMIFLAAFQQMNFFEYNLWILQLFIRSHHWVIGFIKAVMLVSIAGINVFLFWSKKIFVIQKSSFFYQVLFLWIATFFYARVGFERYTLWAIMVLSFCLAMSTFTTNRKT